MDDSKEANAVNSDLTDSQATAHAGLIDLPLHQGERRVLTGWAGTGKTFLLTKLIYDWISDGYRVMVTAPTNQAVSVIRRKFFDTHSVNPELKDRVEFRTVHSALRMKERLRNPEVFFAPDHDDPDTSVEQTGESKPLPDVLVLDECSMCSSYVVSLIQRKLNDIPILFCGDPAQLPPINERLSKTFGMGENYPLSEIVRQAKGNPVLVLAHRLRLAQETGEFNWRWFDEDHNGESGIINREAHKLNASLERMFTSEQFSADPYTARYLCYTNRRCHDVNSRIRLYRYGAQARMQPFAVEERVMFRKPAPPFSTNAEGHVLSLQEARARVVITREGLTLKLDGEEDHTLRGSYPSESYAPWEFQFNTWNVKVGRHRNSDPNAEKEVTTVLHVEDGNTAAKGVLEQAREKLKRECGTINDYTRLHQLGKFVADVRPVYAMTTHCAQGTTLRSAYVDRWDIENLRQKSGLPDFLRLLYTAVTRVSETLIVSEYPRHDSLTAVR